MKHLNGFHGSISKALLVLGVNSKMVLDAVNAKVGEIKPETVDCKAKAKLAGKVAKDGEDKRTVTITESEKRKVKVAATAATMLYALNTTLCEVTDRHGALVDGITLPTEIEAWVLRDAWMIGPVHGPAESATSEVKA